MQFTATLHNGDPHFEVNVTNKAFLQSSPRPKIVAYIEGQIPGVTITDYFRHPLHDLYRN